MDEIAFIVERQGCCGKRSAVEIEINGRRLGELVREVEAEFASGEGSPGMAGAYSGLDSADVLPPSRHFLGEPHADYRDPGGVQVMGCDCGEAGCWPLVCRVEIDDERVVWADFSQPYRSSRGGPSVWRYDGFGPFVFGRKQYDAALGAAASQAEDPEG
jgi:hypothetical protein